MLRLYCIFEGIYSILLSHISFLVNILNCINISDTQNAICGGGRYDTLVEELSGPSTPCFGFALGMERLVSLIPFKEEANPNNNSDIF